MEGIRSASEIAAENREFTLFSWSVQAKADPIAMTGGRGAWFWDADGNQYLDFASQLVNINVGHQHPRMLEAIKAQVDTMCFAGPGMATEPRGKLGRELARVTGLAKSFFTLGGSEANENAIKMARLYTGRDKIVTRYRSYHGATMGAMSASGDPRRLPVEPGVPGVVRVFDPYCYRCPFGKTPDSCSRECVTHIEEVLHYEGPENVAAILVEGITGSNGILVPPDDYFPRLRAICDRHGILLITDEVMSGFGRTGAWLATQHYGIKPDIVTAAKGLTSGYMPLGAVIVNEKIAEFFETNMLWGGLTYSSHPVSCAAAVANLAIYEDERVFENVREQGAYLAERLELMRLRHPCVGDARGKGLFWVLELVKDKATREPLAPFNGTSPEMSRVAALLRERGLYAYTRFNWIFVVPPLVIGREDLDRGLAIIEEALQLADSLIMAPAVAADD